MISDSIDTLRPAPAFEQPKVKRKPKKGESAKKAAKAKKQAKPTAQRANKKAEVITLMKRAKGATLAEIMKATPWQAHTVRGFISIVGKQVGEKIESSKDRTASARAGSSKGHKFVTNTPLPVPAGHRFSASVSHIAY
jgi:hypothetical protein